MSKVSKFYPKNSAENPDTVLERAIGKYKSLVIVGYDHNGYLDVRSDTKLTKKEVLWLIDNFKHKLLSGDYGGE